MGPYIGQGLSLLFGAQILRIYNEPVTLFESIIVQPWQIIFLIIAVPGIILGLFMFSLKDPERKEGLTGDREENESIREVFSYIIKNIGAYMPLLIGSAFIIVFSMVYSLGFQHFYIEFTDGSIPELEINMVL